MFNFDYVRWEFWIPSQIFAFFALIAMIYAMQTKSKAKTLIAVMIFNALMLISTALLWWQPLFNWVLVGIYGVAIARDLVFLWREKKYPNNNKLSITTLIIFLSISVTVAGFTMNFSQDAWLLTLAIVIQCVALFIIYGAWAKGVHLIRISRIVGASIILIQHILFQNFTAIVVEVVSISAVILFYIRFFTQKKQPTMQAASKENDVIENDL